MKSEKELECGHKKDLVIKSEYDFCLECYKKKAKQEEKERLMTKFRYNSREFHNEFAKWDLKKKHGVE